MKKKTQTKLPTTWDFGPLYKSENDPQIAKNLADCTRIVMKFVTTWKSDQVYLTDPSVLKRALDQYNTIEQSYGLSKGYGYYLSLRLAQEETNTKVKAAVTKLKDHAVHLANELDFFTIRLAKVPPAVQKKFLAAQELAPYHRFIGKLFEHAKHVLSEPEERIMNLKSAPAYDAWTDLTSNLLAEETCVVPDDSGKRKVVTVADLLSLISSQKKKVRDTAANEAHRLFRGYARVAEHELNAILDNRKINDLIRGYTRADQSRHLSDDMDSSVVDAMVRVVSDNFDIARRYYKLKAKLLGLPRLAYHERNVVYGKVNKKVSYPEAVDLVGRVLTKVDPEFGQIFDHFTRDGLIDVYPRRNRSSGAFCAHDLPILPTYIFLNHTDQLNDVLTLAHEAGHGINNELIKQKQLAIYFATPLSTAEVASTFMEDFVLREIEAGADDETRLALMMAKLNDEVSTIFRQVACYLFETDLHNNFRRDGYLSKEKIGKMFAKNMSAYMGTAVAQDPGAENWWVYWDHIRNHFYVYSYASGLLISKSLQNKLAADPEFITKIKYFLSAGSSDTPKNIFANIGIDISDTKFWQQGIAEIRELLTATEKLAKKLGKI